MKVKNIIVGGGISGLACAKKLSEAGEEYILIERSNRVGGRVGSIYQDGYIFDIGFQVYNSAYVLTSSLINLNEVDLQFFKPGAIIFDGNDFNIVSDPLRDQGQFFSNLFSPIQKTTFKLFFKEKFNLSFNISSVSPSALLSECPMSVYFAPTLLNMKGLTAAVFDENCSF